MRATIAFCANVPPGRGSRIRTGDLEYPKLPRYQAALCPARRGRIAAIVRYTVRKWPASGCRANDASGRSPAAEDPVRHLVARLDPELAGGASDDLEHAPHRSARGNDARRQRLGILRNAQDAAVAANEDHIERHIGVLHPHRHFLIVLEIEQHAAPLGKLAAEHQPARALLVVDRDLDREDVNAAPADDLEALKLCAFGRSVAERDPQRR